ncbi:hypothetical protein [Embleya scabrispora]|uniref:hypothetical protein n=1 Tax=Embleya scabrispora TaxID=159449 RepID=UPI001180DBF4|nr:hypothetical protein [Embleya scabrispora]
MNESGVSQLRDILKALEVKDTDSAAAILLGLVLDDADGRRACEVVYSCLVGELDEQIKVLAVRCVGHLARIHGEVPSILLKVINGLKSDPLYRGAVEDALDDVSRFTHL